MQLKGPTITIHILFVCLFSLAHNLVRMSFSKLILYSPKPRAPKLIEHLARALLALYHFERFTCNLVDSVSFIIN